MKTSQILTLTALLCAVGCQTSRVATGQHSETAADARAAAMERGNAFAKLEGIWKVEKVVSAGSVIPKEKIAHEFHFIPPNRLVQKGITVGTVTGREREEVIAVDDSKAPAEMNMTRTVRGQKQTVFAIYKIEEDLLTICFLRDEGRQPSTERPTTFESSEATKSDLLLLKRTDTANK